jgi:hypothetical protein
MVWPVVFREEQPMTSQKLSQDFNPNSYNSELWAIAYMLKEIAYQLAATREWEQKRHEENLKQQDDDLNDFVPGTPGEYTKTGPFPQFGYPFPTDLADSEPADRDNRTAASLRQSTAINLLRHIRDEHPDIVDSWLREEIRRFESQEEKS